MAENETYVLQADDKGRKRIVPVDAPNSGVIQESTVWPHGQHQYLQLKESVELQAEGLVTCFMSNVTFFRLYEGRIFGLTGTLGSVDAQRFLMELYTGVDIAFIPTYKPKRFEELPGIVAADHDAWLQAIVASIREQVNARRSAVLAICQTIKDVNKLKNALLGAGLTDKRILTYAKGNQRECDTLKQRLPVGVVVLATNLAGRGTDLKLAEGTFLHVCVTFLPSNLRVQEQAFGRTARQGQYGTAQLILCLSELLKAFSGQDIEAQWDANEWKKRRDLHESGDLNAFK
ncbi:hypothetical protein AAVH_37884 [Aphelenchoides avenae]|nr:hypothetical protein AAVH_37884 [Aphelenchus avenae]